LDNKRCGVVIVTPASLTEPARINRSASRRLYVYLVRTIHKKMRETYNYKMRVSEIVYHVLQLFIFAFCFYFLSLLKNTENYLIDIGQNCDTNLESRIYFVLLLWDDGSDASVTILLLI
jgi:hypothetical protein